MPPLNRVIKLHPWGAGCPVALNKGSMGEVLPVCRNIPTTTSAADPYRAGNFSLHLTLWSGFSFHLWWTLEPCEHSAACAVAEQTLPLSLSALQPVQVLSPLLRLPVKRKAGDVPSAEHEQKEEKACDAEAGLWDFPTCSVTTKHP